MDLTNYKSWHIPRASLSSASNSGQSSTDSIRDFDRRQSDATRHHRQQRKVVDGPQSMPSSSSSSAASINPKTHKNFDREKGQTKMEKLHRGSKSSQGSSSDGINSSHSASSLLLSVANLENFTKMQEKSARSLKHGHEWINKPETTQPSPNHLVLNITNNNRSGNDAKDFDQVSIASSTHFTVVNGFGRSNIKPKSNSICRQGRQITILIVTMSLLFMFGILAAIYLMDTLPDYRTHLGRYTAQLNQQNQQWNQEQNSQSQQQIQQNQQQNKQFWPDENN